MGKIREKSGKIRESQKKIEELFIHVEQQKLGFVPNFGTKLGQFSENPNSGQIPEFRDQKQHCFVLAIFCPNLKGIWEGF